MPAHPAQTWRIDDHEPGFPAALRAVPDAPHQLYVRGARWPDDPVAVAIVGSRAARPGPLACARQLAHDLVQTGAWVFSGGALGIDAAAHRGALAAGGHTVAVLATGVEHAYPPQHAPLFADIVAAGGALVSAVPADAAVVRWAFPRRNRVMAALSDVVVVVEAAKRSGALYTARAARDYGRVLAAVPGSPGTDALLAQGAWPVESAADVWSAYEGEGEPVTDSASLPAPGSDQARVLAVLAPTQAKTVDDVGRQAGLDAAQSARALCRLELEGLALSAPGGGFVRALAADRLLAARTG